VIAVDYTKATFEELMVVAYEDEYAGIMDKAYALIQIMHRQEQMDLYEYL